MEIPTAELETFIGNLDAALEFVGDGEPIPYDIATEGILLDERTIRPREIELLSDEIQAFFKIGETYKLNDPKYYKYKMTAARVTPAFVIFHDDIENGFPALVIHLASSSICRFYREGLFQLIENGKED